MNLKIKMDEMAKDIAMRAMDKYTYEGKTLREWIDLIKVYEEKKDDLISRSAIVNRLSEVEFPDFKKMSPYGRDIMLGVKDLFDSIVLLIRNHPAWDGDPDDDRGQ